MIYLTMKLQLRYILLIIKVCRELKKSNLALKLATNSKNFN